VARETVLFEQPATGNRIRTGSGTGLTMNTVLVIEDQATKQNYRSEPYPMGSALDIQCVCGASIHPIVGAWCRKCGAKVVQIRQEDE
jgi:hypothetical protein